MQVNPSADTEALARTFLHDPSTTLEKKLVASISADVIHAGYAPLDCAFIEWGCLEHELIHIFHGPEAQAIIEYAPGGFIEDV